MVFASRPQQFRACDRVSDRVSVCACASSGSETLQPQKCTHYGCCLYSPLPSDGHANKHGSQYGEPTSYTSGGDAKRQHDSRVDERYGTASCAHTCAARGRSHVQHSTGYVRKWNPPASSRAAMHSYWSSVINWAPIASAAERSNRWYSQPSTPSALGVLFCPVSKGSTCT